VIVKVQYPEVAAHYAADFDNLQVLAAWLFPETLPMVAGLRKRHEGELDFRQEAANLAECRANVQKRFGSRAVLPAVPAPHLVTQHVLAMEYLPGQSLASAIEREQSDMAAALGLPGGAPELRKRTLEVLKAGFRRDNKKDHAPSSGSSKSSGKSGAGGGAEGDEGGGGLLYGGLADLSLAPGLAAWAAAALRTYAASRRTAVELYAGWTAALRRLLASLLFLGGSDVAAGGAGDSDQAASVPGGQEASSSGAHLLSTTGTGTGGSANRVDVGRCLELLVAVHGSQLLLDGCHNADPHPGNVLVLPDGRLGLIDYGMVGRLPLADRLQVAKVVVALADGDADLVARLYAAAGYRAVTTLGGHPQPPAVVHRIATFHLNRIDLSRVNVTPPDATPPLAAEYKSIMRVLHGTLEVAVPDWVEQSRRLGGLLIGVSNQAGRPVSLAAAWAPMAKQLLRDHAHDADAIIAERHCEQAAARQQLNVASSGDGTGVFAVGNLRGWLKGKLAPAAE
jgi:hypothetical protein